MHSFRGKHLTLNFVNYPTERWNYLLQKVHQFSFALHIFRLVIGRTLPSGYINESATPAAEYAQYLSVKIGFRKSEGRRVLVSGKVFEGE